MRLDNLRNSMSQQYIFLSWFSLVLQCHNIPRVMTPFGAGMSGVRNPSVSNLALEISTRLWIKNMEKMRN